jgi:hypothetical protein
MCAIASPAQLPVNQPQRHIDRVQSRAIGSQLGHTISPVDWRLKQSPFLGSVLASGCDSSEAFSRSAARCLSEAASVSLKRCSHATRSSEGGYFLQDCSWLASHPLTPHPERREPRDKTARANTGFMGGSRQVEMVEFSIKDAQGRNRNGRIQVWIQSQLVRAWKLIGGCRSEAICQTGQ